MMDLNPALQPLLVTAAEVDSATFARPHTNIQEAGMTAEAVILCEVFELDVTEMAALGPYRRAKVFKEAQLNIGKWPMLNNIQRVKVNSGLVGLQYQKTNMNGETAPAGRYVPFFIEVGGSVTGVRYEWVFAEDDALLAPISPIAHHFDPRSTAYDRSILRKPNEDMNKESDNGESASIIPSPWLGPALDIMINPLADKASEHGPKETLGEDTHHSQDFAGPPTHRSEHPVPHGGNSNHRSSSQGGELRTYPIFRPQNQITFSPLSNHRYDFEECKVIVNGVDASAVSAIINDDEEVKEGSDGYAVARWEMVLDFNDTEDSSRPFPEPNTFEEWKAIAKEQKKRLKPNHFSEAFASGSGSD